MPKKNPYKLDQVAIRMVKERPLISDEPVNSPEKVVKLVHEFLKDYDREVFAVINFQTNLQPINMNIVSVGALNASMVHPREMLKSIVLGYDRQGIARYAAMRGTISAYKGEVTGSDKHFSFSMSETPDAEHVHLFESAIDAMSFASLAVMEGRDWKQDALLSLAGVFQTKRKDVVPVALSQYLTDHPSVKVLHLHLDNDEVGRGAAAGIIGGLSDRYQVLDEPPDPRYKDMNDQAKDKVRMMKRKEEPER